MADTDPTAGMDPDNPSLSGLSKWLGYLEDKAWAASVNGVASRFLLGNLVLELGRTGLIDARAFIERLLAAAPQSPDHPEEVRQFLEELLLHLPAPGEGGEGGGHPAPRVFH